MEEKEENYTENLKKVQDDVQEQAELSSQDSNNHEAMHASPVQADANGDDLPGVAKASGVANDDPKSQDKEEEVDPLNDLNLEAADKQQVFEALKQFSGEEDMRLVDRALKEIKPYFDKIHNDEKGKALEVFISEGNEEGDFQYKNDELDSSFYLLYNTLRDKKQKYFSQLNKDREANLKKKNQILDQIRVLVDGEETNASIDELKALQAEWKAIGQVPGLAAKTLWANYNAILDRYYDNRSIYFELKELDRKKNLKLKQELCEKAEALNELENIKSAILQLNELHEEYKHLGPVPKEDQEPLWERFKAASDLVYAKRKDFYDDLKKELSHNAQLKLSLGEEVASYVNFDSDRINDWNKKTKEILELQKKWESIGGVPRDQAKEINKHFWAGFKKFFANKTEFFKKLEGQREANLKKKMALLQRAEELKESTDWAKTTDQLKRLQQDWRGIGPVPEKHKNDVYQKFKAACDAFFDRKRSKDSGQVKEYEDNLQAKKEICDKLEVCLQADVIEMSEIYGLLDEYANVGFVPRESIDEIHARFDGVMDKYLALDEISDRQRAELQVKIQVNRLKNSPHGAQKIGRKETAIKRKIGDLESEIDTLRTNMDFFAQSKTADALKEEILNKISRAENEITELQRQLKVFKEL